MNKNPIGYLDGFGIFYKYDNPTTKKFLEAHLGGEVIPLFTKADLEDSYNKSRKQWDWAGGHLYGEREEEEDLTNFQYLSFEEYYKENYEE